MKAAFNISILHDRKTFVFKVEQLPSDKAFDYYKVSGKNGYIIFRNNAPVIRRHKLKHKPVTWKVHSGDIWNVTFKEKIVAQIEKAISKQG